MINADNIYTPEQIWDDKKTSVIDFPELPYFDMAQYDIYNEKDYARFIQDTERIVRMSYEYRRLINYLKETELMNKCTFLENVTNMDNTQVQIEIHHSPLTLYDICSTVICKRLHTKESIEIYDVAEEVMYLHYKGFVGLVPLCTTVHELVHNQFLFIPTHIIRGNYREFINLYLEWMDPMLLENIERAESITAEYLADPNNRDNIVNAQMQIFNLHATYISVGNVMPFIQAITEAKERLKNRIAAIKSGKKILYHLVKTVDKK